MHEHMTATALNAARRRFLVDIARTAGGAALVGLGLWLYARQSAGMPPQALRPPGALDEPDFLGACVRCGLCVRDCPYGTLRVAELGDAVATGTPYFVARETACEMCDDIPCVAACPTGALNKDLQDIDDARMGLAVLVDQETCLNYLGLRCDVCYRVCPAIDKAITLDVQHNVRSGHHSRFLPVVHSEHCTGCGKCENACVLPVAAIKVIHLGLAKGRAAGHYRLGWEEKRKAGGSLVEPDRERRFNMPEGVRYEYEGEGVIIGPDAPASATPYEDDPVKALNRGLEKR